MSAPTVLDQGAVVVGVNGALAGYRQALIFAAHEARLRNTVIRLVHGCEPLSTLTERQPWVPLMARERQARRQLRDAAGALRPLLDPGATVEFRIDPRTGIDTLLDQSSTAELIVLQRRDLTTLGRITAGSTSSAVAARAGCPVAVTSTGQRSSHGRGAVLVGIDDVAHAERVLPLAFAEAAARMAQLTAIQVSTIRAIDGSRFPRTAGEAAGARNLVAWASEALDRWAANFPHVVVNHITIAGDAVEVLQEASAAAELLVIGRHRGKERALRSLGHRARQLINTAQCPVVVAAPARTGTGDDQSRLASLSDARQRSSASSPR